MINYNCPKDKETRKMKKIQDFKYGGVRVNQDKYNQGGTNVHNCIEIWIKNLEEELK